MHFHSLSINYYEVDSFSESMDHDFQAILDSFFIVFKIL